MIQPFPQIARLAFVVHLVVAVVVGAPLLLAPGTVGALLGYPDAPAALIPVLRGFGAMILAFGGITSFYGVRSPDWQHVDYIVRGEIAFLALLTLVFLFAALSGVGPDPGNWIFAGASAVMLALFAAGFASRPK